MEDLTKSIQIKSKLYFNEIREIREYLHQYPELSNEESKTASFLAGKLKEYGIPIKQGIGGNGIVGLIRGKNPDKQCIAIRADMDALPINEVSKVPYKSTVHGKMHACGHDVHMACLLGAGRILNDLKETWEGTVKLIFQPSEETYPGGAVRMIAAGVLENPAPDAVIALHVINTLEAGQVGFKPGPYMASTDEVFLTVKGHGGHAATPNYTIDPVLIASHIVVALQQIVSRNADPTIPTVLSFGKVVADGRTNIIPDEVRLEGTVRTYDETWRKEIHEKIAKISGSLAESMGGTCEVTISHGYPFLHNDENLTRDLKSFAIEYLGTDHVKDLEMRMTAEDFAYFARHVPSCMFRLGIANASRGITSNLHTATFDVDESSIETGMGILAWLSVNLLNKAKTA